MPKLAFYRQARFDGGVRTGVELTVELDGEELGDVTILEDFEEGDAERDPALLWFVDVRCQGPDVPGEVESARRWLLSTHPAVEAGLQGFADHLRAVGSDIDDYPLQWSRFPTADEGVERKIVCSAIRRVDARGLAEILDDVRIHWVERIERMIAKQTALSSAT